MCLISNTPNLCEVYEKISEKFLKQIFGEHNKFPPLRNKQSKSLINPLNCWQIASVEPLKWDHFNLTEEDCIGPDIKISYHDYCSEAKNTHLRKLRSSSFLTHT